MSIDEGEYLRMDSVGSHVQPQFEKDKASRQQLSKQLAHTAAILNHLSSLWGVFSPGENLYIFWWESSNSWLSFSQPQHKLKSHVVAPVEELTCEVSVMISECQTRIRLPLHMLMCDLICSQSTMRGSGGSTDHLFVPGGQESCGPAPRWYIWKKNMLPCTHSTLSVWWTTNCWNRFKLWLMTEKSSSRRKKAEVTVLDGRGSTAGDEKLSERRSVTWGQTDTVTDRNMLSTSSYRWSVTAAPPPPPPPPPPPLQWANKEVVEHKPAVTNWSWEFSSFCFSSQSSSAVLQNYPQTKEYFNFLLLYDSSSLV